MTALTRIYRMLYGLPLLYFEIIIFLALLLLVSYGLIQDLQASRTVAVIYNITISLAVCSLSSHLLRSQAVRTWFNSVRMRAILLRDKLTLKNQPTKKLVAQARAQADRIKHIEAEKDREIHTSQQTIRELKSQVLTDRADRNDSVHGSRTFSWFLHENDMKYPLVVTTLSHIHPSLETTCIICFDDFKYGDKVTELPCNHGFTKSVSTSG